MSEDRLELRAKPQSVRRFNRKALIAIGGVTGMIVCVAAAYALRSPDHSSAGQSQELYNTTTKAMPDGLNDLPVSYAEVKPTLGPPLPGDLGAAMINNERDPVPTDNPFRYEPSVQGVPSGRSAGQSHRTTQQQLRDAASSSPLFFISRDQQAGSEFEGLVSTASNQPTGYDQLSALLAPSQSGGGVPLTSDPNRQARKEAFLGAEVDDNIYNPHRLQTPVSPYQVMAGTIIPASLITGMNSDLPGQVIAQVTENVYDTPTGDYLLIPQGSRLIGRYDSVIAFGQSRALVVWNRLIMPDGSSITIENLPGVDLSGYAGLEDQVDHHTWGLFKAAILSSVLSIGSELGRDTDDGELLDALRDGGQRTVNQAGQQIVTRQLSVQPTIKIRPGWRLRVIVNKDLVLQPYGG